MLTCNPKTTFTIGDGYTIMSFPHGRGQIYIAMSTESVSQMQDAYKEWEDEAKAEQEKIMASINEILSIAFKGFDL